jgi:hypothetical protein
MQIETVKKYVVEVYSDKDPLEASPWHLIGEFNSPSQATEACKRIVDDFLYESFEKGLDAKALANQFLSYSDIPCINRGDNPNIFDVYTFLDMRCTQFNRRILGLL